jgi:hypothetical protein
VESKHLERSLADLAATILIGPARTTGAR